jgi:hypothetical protein
MLDQLLNEAIERSDYLLHNRCTQLAHTHPNTIISSAARNSILLKARTPLREGRIRDQGVGGSNPLAPTIISLAISTPLRSPEPKRRVLIPLEP